MYRTFYPSRKWLDAAGHPIQAYNGGIVAADGLFYWYGMSQEKTDGKNGILHRGVRCYVSRDLYNWDDKGWIIAPDQEHPGFSLHPDTEMDQPRILFNENTGKYVCWMKCTEPDGVQTFANLTADHILGPYTTVRTGIKPLGMCAGAFDLAADPDGRGYCFQRVHGEILCAELTEDYTDSSGVCSACVSRLMDPPFARESIAHFSRRGKHYLITSDAAGYKPGPSVIAAADSWNGPYQVLGNLRSEGPTDPAYHSRISSVFRIPGTDLYIALADCMAGDDPAYRKHFDPAGTAKTRYVWLPICFEGDIPVIRMLDNWRWQEFIGPIWRLG